MKPGVADGEEAEGPAEGLSPAGLNEPGDDGCPLAETPANAGATGPGPVGAASPVGAEVGMRAPSCSMPGPGPGAGAIDPSE